MSTMPRSNLLMKCGGGLIAVFVIATYLYVRPAHLSSSAQARQATYSCDFLAVPLGVCYGVVQLPAAQSGSSFKGFATKLTAVQLNGGDDGWINNELWVVQSSSACAQSSCWIEVGLTADPFGLDSRAVHVFWAANSPNGWVFHDLGALKIQELNQKVFLMIRPHYLVANAFDVDVETCADGSSNGCDQRWLISTSTKNSMVGNQVFMGMELFGDSGASAPEASFTETVFLDPSAPFGGTYLTSAGSVISSPNLYPPIQAGWTTTPASSNFGGSFFTSCCQSSTPRER